MTASEAQHTPAGSDADLLEWVRAGDEAAFAELAGLAGPRMLAVARKMMPREEEALDAVQDAFLNAFRSLEKFDGRSQLTTWLHRITVNACLMKLRSRRRRPERPIEELLPAFKPDGHQVVGSSRWQDESSAGLSRAEVRELVRRKIAELPEPYRVVLVLRDIEELSTEETAEALGLTPNAVKTRLHRARQALRGLLDPLFHAPEMTP